MRSWDGTIQTGVVPCCEQRRSKTIEVVFLLDRWFGHAGAPDIFPVSAFRRAVVTRLNIWVLRFFVKAQLHSKSVRPPCPLAVTWFANRKPTQNFYGATLDRSAMEYYTTHALFRRRSHLFYCTMHLQCYRIKIRHACRFESSIGSLY